LLLLVSFREIDAEAAAFRTAPAGLAKRHSRCAASGRAASLSVEKPIAERYTIEEILETAAAFSYRANRRRLYRKWEHSGLLILETSPQNISSALINRYLEVKKSGRL
jgi:hypothetical protein